MKHETSKPESLWNQQQTALFLNAKPGTLERWRWAGEGPKFIKVGRLVRYRPSDVQEWLDDKTQHSGSES